MHPHQRPSPGNIYHFTHPRAKTRPPKGLTPQKYSGIIQMRPLKQYQASAERQNPGAVV